MKPMETAANLAANPQEGNEFFVTWATLPDSWPAPGGRHGLTPSRRGPSAPGSVPGRRKQTAASALKGPSRLEVDKDGGHQEHEGQDEERLTEEHEQRVANGCRVHQQEQGEQVKEDVRRQRRASHALSALGFLAGDTSRRRRAEPG